MYKNNPRKRSASGQPLAEQHNVYVIAVSAEKIPTNKNAANKYYDIFIQDEENDKKRIGGFNFALRGKLEHYAKSKVPVRMSWVEGARGPIFNHLCKVTPIISLTLKRRLSDRSYVNRQNVRPALVNKALKKLVEVNLLYKNVTVDQSWENVSEETDPELWNLLTNENATDNDKGLETDSDEDIEGNIPDETEKK